MDAVTGATQTHQETQMIRLFVSLCMLVSVLALSGCFNNDNHDEEEAASAVNQRDNP